MRFVVKDLSEGRIAHRSGKLFTFSGWQKKLILCAAMCAVGWGDILSGNLLTALIMDFSSERKRKFSIVIFDFHHSQLHYF